MHPRMAGILRWQVENIHCLRQDSFVSISRLPQGPGLCQKSGNFVVQTTGGCVLPQHQHPAVHLKDGSGPL